MVIWAGKYLELNKEFMATALRSLTRAMRRSKLLPMYRSGSMLHTHATSFGELSHLCI